MRTPLALLALLCALPALAGDPKPPVKVAEPPSKAVEEPRFYFHPGRIPWWGNVVHRSGIDMSSDLPNLEEVCMIMPAASWISDGASEEIQQKYLKLLWRTAYSVAEARGKENLRGRTLGTCGVNADKVLIGLGELQNFYFGSHDAAIKEKYRFQSCTSTKDFVKGAPKYASYGQTRVLPGVAVIETLNLLLKSKHPQTVLEALGVVRVLNNSESFRDSVEALVRDKSLKAEVTIHPDGYAETLPLRVYAMRTLATIERTERSAKILALIWHDEKEPQAIREGAIRAFAFITEWPDTAIKTMTSPEARKAMHKTLYPFLAPLMMIAAVEYDKKEEAGPKAQVSPLGNAASCAVDRFPRELHAKARKGEKY